MDDPVSLVLLIVFGIAGTIQFLIFCIEIEPALKRMGHEYDVLSIRKYKNGFFRTLWEYKKNRIAEHKPLTWWWVYWASLWIILLIWGRMMLFALSN